MKEDENSCVFKSDCGAQMFKIREFDEKDTSALVEIFDEAFSEELARGMPPVTAERFIELSKRSDVKIFVAEDHGEVVGYLAMTEGDGESPSQVHMVAVKKSLQGRGIGKKLVGKALEHVKALGRKKVKLFTRPWNVTMSKICIELGFIPEAYLRREYLNEDLVLYSAFF